MLYILKKINKVFDMGKAELMLKSKSIKGYTSRF